MTHQECTLIGIFQPEEMQHSENICGELSFQLECERKDHQYVKFMKLLHDVDIQEVMQSKWQLPSPRITLMIVSDVAPLHGWKNYKQIKAFTKGLIKAANTTSMRICTHGLNVGIVKIIGEAVEREVCRRESSKCHEHRHVHKYEFPPIVLLGICKEQLVSYSTELIQKDSPIELHNERNSVEGKFDLNPFHSHFIVCGSQMQDNSILQRISEVPAIILLIQGDMSCIQSILFYIKRRLPVVVIKSSGGLADLIAYAYYEINNRPLGMEDAEYVENILKPELNYKISHNIESQPYDDSSRRLCCEGILDCIRYSQQCDCLTIINLLDPNCKLEEGLTVHLQEALFKSQDVNNTEWRSQMEKDLYLAMDWNSPDVAMREVFFKDSSGKFEIGHKIFQDALTSPDREEFASLFIRQGFKVHTYMNVHALLSLFQHSRDQEFFSSICEGVLGRPVASKINQEFLDLDLNLLIEELSGIPAFINLQELECTENLQAIDIEAAERKARTILTMWAVLSNRTTLAKFLWMHSDYPINLALIISMIFQKLRSFVTEIGQKEEMEKKSKKFAEMATGILDRSYKEMPCRAYDALYEENPDFALRTAVEIAAVAKNRMFLSHPCCQKLLDYMFLGNIRIQDVTLGGITFPDGVKVLFSSLLIFPMYLFIRFKDDNHSEEYEDVTELNGDNNGCEITPRCSNPEVENYKSNKTKFPSLGKMIFLMWSAPITKFWTFQIFYMMYLALFSLAVLWPSCGNRMLDISVCVWTSLLVMESIHRTFILNKKCSTLPLLSKCLEILLIVIFICLYVLVRVVGYGIFLEPYNGKVLLCCGLLYFYYRYIFIVMPISPTLGPLLYRIRCMVWEDFANFLLMAILVIVSNGIIIHATIYPDFPISSEMFTRAFHRAWISLFLTPAGDFGDADVHCVPWIRKPHNSCVVGRYIDYTCPNTGLWPYLFGMQFFILLKVVLIALLYALFNSSQRRMENESDIIWKYQRFKLVVDFAHSLRLPAPLNIFSLFSMVKEVLVSLCSCNKEKRGETRLKGNKGMRFLPTYYNYWRQLAYNYGSKQIINEEEVKDAMKRHIDRIKEDMSYQRHMIYSVRSHFTELQANITSIMATTEKQKFGFLKEEAVQEERQRNRDRCENEVESTSNLHGEISIDKILEAELRIEAKQEPVDSSDPVTNICKVADRQLFQLIEWAKHIPHFCGLPLEDRIVLLKAGWNELLIAAFSHRSVGIKDGIVLASGHVVHRNSAHGAGVGTIFDRVLTELVTKMREMKMDKTELGCLRAIILFNPEAKGLSSTNEVANLRDKVYAALEEYCKQMYPDQSGRFAKLLLRLPALRSIGLKCLEHLLFFKLVGNTPVDTFLTSVLKTSGDT